VPFYDAHEVKLCRVLTDRGTEYCGNPEQKRLGLFMAMRTIPAPARASASRAAEASGRAVRCPVADRLGKASRRGRPPAERPAAGACGMDRRDRSASQDEAGGVGRPTVDERITS
jgi:hypothetical protein